MEKRGMVGFAASATSAALVAFCALVCEALAATSEVGALETAFSRVNLQ